MPITTDLNIDPYFDDFDIEKQFYRIMFKPSYAVQARELTQMQTILQNQIERFGNNIFQEGTIIRGCNFTELDDLEFVKVRDRAATTTTAQFDPTQYIGGINGDEEIRYELVGQESGLRASIVSASRGFETRPPDLNTFYINYLNSNQTQQKRFIKGEQLNINRVRIVNDVVQPVQSGDSPVTTINVTSLDNRVGRAFGLRAASGVIYQRGHFLYVEEQLIIVSKYTNYPTDVSVGYVISEDLISYLEDATLLDNANGYFNQNAPGADRLKLTPVLTVRPTTEAEADSQFFILSRYVSGNAVQVRDVTQYNVIGKQMAQRSKETVGNHVVRDFNVAATRLLNANTIGANTNVAAVVGEGVAYVEGYRVETVGSQYIPIDNISTTKEVVNQTVSFDYGGYTKIGTITGNVPFMNFTPVDLQTSGGTDIGTALVKNITSDRVYLFDVRMDSGQSFSSVQRIANPSGTNGYITLANNTILQDKSRSVLVFDTGMFSLKNVDNVFLPLRESSSAFTIDTGNDELVISASPGYDFDNVGNTVDNVVVVDASNTKLSIDSVAVSPNKQDLTISFTAGQSPSAGCTAYYNIRAQDAAYRPKISKDTWIKTTFASGTTKYNLGFPDVYEIISITDSGGTDVTASFKLNINQRDNFYDHSYIELLPGRTTPANGTLTINLRVFEPNTTQGMPFYTVASYPVDVPAYKIPVFTSSSGKVFNLRECFDFRPHVDLVSGADYDTANAAAASTIAATINLTPSFSGSMIVPALASSGNADYEYYLSRRDAIAVDRFGKFSLIKGEEAEDAIPPTVSPSMKIADVYVPGFPMLSPEEATTQNRPRYAVQSTQRGPRTYKMKDIQDLQRTVEQLRYYVVLSQLEASTRNLNIVDADGRSRFKNGIIVDPFNDLTIAEVGNNEFNVAIDKSEKSITPRVRSFPMNLVYKSATAATVYPSVNDAKVGTLGRDQNIVILEQPYATSYRNCVSNYYSYKGSGFIEPEYEVGYDTVTNPATLNIDVFGPINQLVENINEIVPLTRTDTEVIWQAEAPTTEVITSGNIEQTWSVLDRTLEDVRRDLQVNEVVDTQQVGDFVSDFAFKPYMRSTEVKIWMAGLRPNTTHYFFFDGQSVDEHIAPGTDVDNISNVEKSGDYGTPITTDDFGVLTAIFFIPEETFFVGDRKLEIIDVSDYETAESAATSYGSLMYRAYNFSVDKSSFSVTTRMPSSEVIVTRFNERPDQVRTLVGERRIRRKDPLAQTFYVKEALGIDTDTVFISAVDLYFKRKSTINGVSVMIREVINGTPAEEIIPFSKVHLTPAQVNVSNDSSLATTISFRAPIRLDADKEYAIVVMPDANDPDYLIYTSVVGGTDFIDGLPVNSDWGDGVLFTSTNNRAWQSYQDEDIKFTLYRHNFNESVGTITLKNDDHEFLSIQGSIGKFRVGEFIYVEQSVAAGTSNTVSVVAGEDTISGTALGSTYSVGDIILFDDGGGNKDYFKIEAVAGDLMTVNKPASFTSTGSGVPVVGGQLVYYNTRNPNSLVVIEHSNASTTKYIQANDMLYGIVSGASAEIVSVDNIDISYMQPMILRTNDTATRTTMSGRFVRADNTNLNFIRQVKFNDACRFNGQGMTLYSRSNDTLSLKPFELTITLENGGNVTTTPFIDIETAKVFAYQYLSTNNTATSAKYISKSVELAEDLDAEDFELLLTAYRPAGTDVKVYFKAQNVYDPVSFDVADWIELERFKGDSLFSASNNIHDFREYSYRIPSTSKTNGIFTYTNDDGIEFSTFGRFAVKIEMLSDNVYDVPRILDYRGIALT